MCCDHRVAGLARAMRAEILLLRAAAGGRPMEREVEEDARLFRLQGVGSHTFSEFLGVLAASPFSLLHKLLCKFGPFFLKLQKLRQTNQQQDHMTVAFTL